MPLLVVLVLLALACAPTEPAPTPADVPTEAAADAPAGLDGASDAGPSDAGRTDAADGSVPDTLTDAPLPRDASDAGVPLCPAGQVWCGSYCSALDTVANCGRCGDECCPGGLCPPVSGGFVICAAATMCTYACDDRHLDCDGSGANGCETERSRRNCGACGHACSMSEECASGRLCCRIGDSACLAAAAMPG